MISALVDFGEFERFCFVARHIRALSVEGLAIMPNAKHDRHILGKMPQMLYETGDGKKFDWLGLGHNLCSVVRRLSGHRR